MGSAGGGAEIGRRRRCEMGSADGSGGGAHEEVGGGAMTSAAGSGTGRAAVWVRTRSARSFSHSGILLPSQRDRYEAFIPHTAAKLPRVLAEVLRFSTGVSVVRAHPMDGFTEE
jgi:uncharacterized protein YfiM (DUF2279 family)